MEMSSGEYSVDLNSSIAVLFWLVFGTNLRLPDNWTKSREWRDFICAGPFMGAIFKCEEQYFRAFLVLQL